MTNKLLIALLCVAMLFSCQQEDSSLEQVSGEANGLVLPDQKSGVNNYNWMTKRYKTMAGVNRNLHELDIYYPTNMSNRPVVIYVHGGGWKQGDKSQQLQNKINLAMSNNIVLVSVNYRLSPNPANPSNIYRVKYPDHNNDVADAVMWVYQNITTFNGDKDNLVLLGHSAGGHLVSLTGTRKSLLQSRGFPMQSLKGVASIDIEAYNIYKKSITEGNITYHNAFGTDANTCFEASPEFNLWGASGYYPRFFIGMRGSANWKADQYKFIQTLQGASIPVDYLDAGNAYNHAQINDAIGAPGETIITPALLSFFNTCFNN